MAIQPTSQILAGDIQLSAEDIFASLHRRGQLLPLFRGVAMEAIIEHAARKVGLTVSDQELQAASEELRRHLGLQSAEKTLQWLAEERLSVEQLERRVELDVLTEKLKNHLLERFGEERFHSNIGTWAPVKLRRMILSSLSEARELQVQIQEEGADFATLASRQSLDPHDRQTGGDLGVILRQSLRTAVAEAVFSVGSGDITLPIHGPEGYELYLVDGFPAPIFDDMTQSAIREELFRSLISLQLSDMEFFGPHFSSSAGTRSNPHVQSGTLVPTSDF